MNLFDSIRIYFKAAYSYLALVFSLIKYWKNGKKTFDASDEEDISNQVVVITGGSQGLGKASAIEFAKRKAKIVIGCRGVGNGLKVAKEIEDTTGNQNVEVIFLDLSDLDSVVKFASEVRLKYPAINILLNNSGVVPSTGEEENKTKDGFDYVMTVNYLGHFLLTHLLLDNLKQAAPSRVISVSSTALLLASFVVKDMNINNGRFAWKKLMPYFNSKYAVALFAKELGKRLTGSGVTTYAVCPGIVTTNLFNSGTTMNKAVFSVLCNFVGYTAEQAASEYIMYQACSKKLASETGQMYRFKKPFKAVNKQLSNGMAHDLFEFSADLVNLDDRISKQKSLPLHYKFGEK